MTDKPVCFSLRNKAALLLHRENAFLKAIEPEVQDETDRRKANKEAIRTASRVRYSLAFGIASDDPLRTTVESKSELQDISITHIVQTTKRLREAKCSDGITPKYPDLAVLPAIKPEDLKNVPTTSEDVYEFGRKLGFIRRKKHSLDVDNGQNSYIRDSDGELRVHRQGVIKALDKEISLSIRAGCSYFLDEKMAKDIINPSVHGYMGVYAVYFRHVYDRDAVCYMRATFRISYDIKYESSGCSIIRCKLNVPDLNSDYDVPNIDPTASVKRYQYRGRFMPIDGANHLFAFLDLDLNSIEAVDAPDELSEINPDVFTIVLSELGKKHIYTTGIVSSVSQRLRTENEFREQRRAYSSKAVFARQKFGDIGVLERDESEYDFMRLKPKIFSSLEALEKEGKEEKYVVEHFFRPEDNTSFNGVIVSNPIVD